VPVSLASLLVQRAGRIHQSTHTQYPARLLTRAKDMSNFNHIPDRCESRVDQFDRYLIKEPRPLTGTEVPPHVQTHIVKPVEITRVCDHFCK